LQQVFHAPAVHSIETGELLVALEYEKKLTRFNYKSRLRVEPGEGITFKAR
jgi:hypothetical protein